MTLTLTFETEPDSIKMNWYAI